MAYAAGVLLVLEGGLFDHLRLSAEVAAASGADAAGASGNLPRLQPHAGERVVSFFRPLVMLAIVAGSCFLAYNFSPHHKVAMEMGEDGVEVPVKTSDIFTTLYFHVVPAPVIAGPTTGITATTVRSTATSTAMTATTRRRP